MNKNYYRKLNRNHYSLGDLIQIVSSCSKNSKEAVAALADLFASGRVVTKGNGVTKRLRVATT